MHMLYKDTEDKYEDQQSFLCWVSHQNRSTLATEAQKQTRVQLESCRTSRIAEHPENIAISARGFRSNAQSKERQAGHFQQSLYIIIILRF